MKRDEQYARFLILAIFALTLYFLFLVVRPFFSGIAWALFFATAFYPLYRLILKGVKRDWTAAILTTAIVAFLILGPGLYLVNKLTDEARRVLFEHIPTSASGGGQLIVEQIGKLELWLGQYFDASKLHLQEAAVNTLQNIGKGILDQTTPFVQNALRVLLTFGVMLATMVVILRDGPRVISFARRSLPLNDADKDAVIARLQEVTRAVFYGVMMTAAVQGTLGAIGWLMVGLPEPLVFGIAFFFAALIPFGGTALVWGPGAIYLYSHDSSGKALLLVLWGLLVVGGIDNVLKPIFIGSRGRLHMLFVFFGIFGGLTAFGLKGLFLGPLVITLFLFMLEVIRRELLQNKDITLN